jgi:glycosyltransferase involved in cell wall biosynthesis
MIVKNEDQWVYYAIQSVLSYVDEFLIVDTGSTDHTVEIIRSIKSKKIKFTESQVTTPGDMTKLRNSQIQETKSDWIWLVDGDEIYPKSVAEEVVTSIKQQKYRCITIRRNDLLGDIYHAQLPSVGSYEIFGEKGHLVTRAFNLSQLPKLKVVNDYPLEEYVYGDGDSTSRLPLSQVYIARGYLYHAMYLRRSSLGASLTHMFNRTKFKIETGIAPIGTIPEVFSLSVSGWDLDPRKKRGVLYEILARLITPIKNLKRRFV